MVEGKIAFFRCIDTHIARLGKAGEGRLNGTVRSYLDSQVGQAPLCHIG